MTPSQRKAINTSKTMQVLIRAMLQDGEDIAFKSDHRNAIGDCVAQVRTENMVFDWIVTARGRIVHEHYSIILPHMREALAA